MVRLSRIYTKTGDDGDTGLGDGTRVPKTDPRVGAYGTVDEANAAVGLAVVELRRGAGAGAPADVLGRVADLLASTQHDLFDVGADLCTPIRPDEAPGSRLRVLPAQTERLESAIDEFNEPLPALNSFVLPGGTPQAAALHLARTIVRRAEREVCVLLAAQPGATNPETVRYLNRLSDLLFVLSRVVNAGRDVLWVPGSSRPKA